MDDAELIRRFEACDFTPGQWTHREHVRLAWICLARHGFDETRKRLRAGLIALSVRFGVADSLTTGYHETITVAWLRLIAAAIARYGPGEDSRAFMAEQTQFGSKRLLRQYYSKERLVSERAKREFVTPDLAPLPSVPVPLAGPVRRANSADVEALLELNPQPAISPRALERFLASVERGQVLVVEDQGLIAMLVFNYDFFDRAFIDHLYVRPSHRRMGHGRNLMQTAIALCETPVLFTSTNASNAPMHAMLESLGFTRCGEVDQLDPGDPEWFYVLHRT